MQMWEEGPNQNSGRICTYHMIYDLCITLFQPERWLIRLIESTPAEEQVHTVL